MLPTFKRVGCVNHPPHITSQQPTFDDFHRLFIWPVGCQPLRGQQHQLYFYLFFLFPSRLRRHKEKKERHTQIDGDGLFESRSFPRAPALLGYVKWIIHFDCWRFILLFSLRFIPVVGCYRSFFSLPSRQLAAAAFLCKLFCAGGRIRETVFGYTIEKGNEM